MQNFDFEDFFENDYKGTQKPKDTDKNNANTTTTIQNKTDDLLNDLLDDYNKKPAFSFKKKTEGIKDTQNTENIKSDDKATDDTTKSTDKDTKEEKPYNIYDTFTKPKEERPYTHTKTISTTTKKENKILHTSLKKDIKPLECIEYIIENIDMSTSPNEYDLSDKKRLSKNGEYFEYRSKYKRKDRYGKGRKESVRESRAKRKEKERLKRLLNTKRGPKEYVAFAVRKKLRELGIEEWELANYDIELKNKNIIKLEKALLREEKRLNTRTDGLGRSAYIRGEAYEQQILKSLGISSKQLEKLVSPSSSLSSKEKDRILSVGLSGNKSMTDRKGTSSVTGKDIEILEYIAVAKVVSIKNITLALSRKYSIVKGQLDRLETLGLVNKLITYGTVPIYALTNTGKAYIGSDFEIGTNKEAKPNALAERLYVNHTLAICYSNRYNILCLDDFPAKNRLHNGKYVRGETILPEYVYQSAVGKKIASFTNIFEKTSVKGENLLRLKELSKALWNKWESEGRDITKSPELLKENRWLYTLYGNSISKFMVIPDYVIVRPRNADGTPNNIAVEVERKQGVGLYDDLVRKLRVYREDVYMYSKIIYITYSKRIHDTIIEAAKNTNMLDKIQIVPMLDSDGNMTNETNGWLM